MICSQASFTVGYLNSNPVFKADSGLIFAPVSSNDDLSLPNISLTIDAGVLK